MVATGERSVSGRALVVSGLVVAALITAAAVVLGPPLREDVRQEERPRTLREPVAAGEHGGETWEAVARYDGTANCVELRYRGEVLGRACDVGPTEASTTLPADGPTIAYGVADETAARTEVVLSDGSTARTDVVAGDLGFPVGFWALQLPPGTAPAAGSAP